MMRLFGPENGWASPFGALLLAVAMWPAVSAAEDDHGKVVFEYVDPATSQCVPGIEAPFRAAFNEIDILLVPIESLSPDYGKCVRSVRRALERQQIVVDCKDGTKLKNRVVRAQLDGTAAACQRGGKIHLVSTALSVTLPTAVKSLEVANYPKTERDVRFRHHRSFSNFIERLLLRQSWTGIDYESEARFLLRPEKVNETISDLPVQHADMLPTDDVYGIIVETTISTKFGTITNIKDGDTQ